MEEGYERRERERGEREGKREGKSKRERVNDGGSSYYYKSCTSTCGNGALKRVPMRFYVTNFGQILIQDHVCILHQVMGLQENYVEENMLGHM